MHTRFKVLLVDTFFIQIIRGSFAVNKIGQKSRLLLNKHYSMLRELIGLISKQSLFEKLQKLLLHVNLGNTMFKEIINVNKVNQICEQHQYLNAIFKCSYYVIL